MTNYRSIDIFDQIEQKDLIVLYLYQMQNTSRQLKEVKSGLLLALSTETEKDKELIIKIIVLMKAASNSQNNDESDDNTIIKINTILARTLIHYFCPSSTKRVFKEVDKLKKELQALKKEDLSIVPIRSDNLLFYLKFFKYKFLIFKNIVQPIIYDKNPEYNFERKICKPYYVFTRSLHLLNNIADILFRKARII
ncbi:hypothetical protein NGRA_2287 [Nosema granulosis]|uniref:Uncharacterized protein n=1 Tax=Nosema granulosis TaxID=83296 RepID=A0A9P6GXY3_9MICR|nr:hypothetical protein NGRA_2287 [Nosema granulosis]